MARAHSYFLNAPKAIRLFEQALNGMNALRSDDSGTIDLDDQPNESDVLYLEMELASELTKDTSPIGHLRFAEAEQLLKQTAARRIALSGKEHPLTLLTQASLGRAMAANGHTTEAVQLMSETLAAAERNFGGDHLVVLAGKAWYASALAQHGDLEGAERYLREASNETKYAKAAAADGEHIDRIGHAWSLSDVLMQRGKLNEALDLCSDLRKALPRVGGHGLGSKHPINERLDKRITEIKQMMRDGAILGSEAHAQLEEAKHKN
jgi:tetratricopeptide (TPR) repeat protein